RQTTQNVVPLRNYLEAFRRGDTESSGNSLRFHGSQRAHRGFHRRTRANATINEDYFSRGQIDRRTSSSTGLLATLQFGQGVFDEVLKRRGWRYTCQFLINNQ